MRRILKRIIRRDQHGDVIHEFAEAIVQNGTDVKVFSMETYQSCESCLRPLKLDDIRGICQTCGRMTCSCAVSCSVCSKSLCGSCTKGLVLGNSKITVCQACLPEAKRNLQLAQKVEMQSAKMRLLQSSLLDMLPGSGLIRQIGELAILKKLKEYEGKIR